MPEEIFDVVNEHDEVIGQKPRSEIHRLKLNHRAVHVLVFNSRGELFLQKRSMKKDCFPGVWDSSASGHLASGESYDACAVRELREEIGLEPAMPPERLLRSPPVPRPAGNSCGCIAARRKGRSGWTRRRSSAARGLPRLR